MVVKVAGRDATARDVVENFKWECLVSEWASDTADGATSAVFCTLDNVTKTTVK